MFSKLSIAPDNAKPSILFLFTALLSNLAARSNTFLYGPLASRSSTIAFTTFSPTPLILAIPKRMLPFAITLNLPKPSLTSGPNTFKPARLHSSIKKAIASILPA